jgi:hypothetical protein
MRSEILHEISATNEPESRIRSGVSSGMDLQGRSEKLSNINADEY